MSQSCLGFCCLKKMQFSHLSLILSLDIIHEFSSFRHHFPVFSFLQQFLLESLLSTSYQYKPILSDFSSFDGFLKSHKGTKRRKSNEGIGINIKEKGKGKGKPEEVKKKY